jgi:conserved domain protein
MKHLKIFDTSADLQTYMDGPDYLEPFVGTDTQKSVLKYNRVAQNVIRIFTQRGGVTLAKYLDDQMSNMEEFVLKEGWNNLDMTNAFKYGFGNVNGEDLNDLTQVDLSRYQGTNLFHYMFYNTGIKTIILPDTIEEIGVGTFGSCRKLNSVHFGTNIKKIGQMSFSECYSLAEINLPEGIEELDIRAFSSVICSKLILPNSINKLGYNCYGPYKENVYNYRGTVRFQTLEPPIINTKFVFSNVNRIEVPMASVEKYKNINVNGWKEAWGDKIVGY